MTRQVVQVLKLTRLYSPPSRNATWSSQPLLRLSCTCSKWALERRQWYSTQKESTKSDTSTQTTGTEIDIARESPYAGLSFGDKVKEVGKDASYTGFIIVAVGVLGTIIYAVSRELLSGNSVNGVYNRAFKRCVNDTELAAALGEPIKGYGETSRRGRRRHVSHTEYMAEDQRRLRMQFYVEGTDKKGTVQLEMVKGDTGKYDYRFLLVQLNEYPYRTFILEDNR